MIPIPAIDLRGGRVVRLSQGDYNQQRDYDFDAVTLAQRYATEGAQRLHVGDRHILETVAARRTAIARCHKNLVDLGRLAQFPGHRVFASATTHHQHFHTCSFHIAGSVPSHSAALW